MKFEKINCRKKLLPAMKILTEFKEIKVEESVRHGLLSQLLENQQDDTEEIPTKHMSSNTDGVDGDYSDIMYKMLDDTDENECYDEENEVDNDELQTQHMNNIVYKIKNQEQQNRNGIIIDNNYTMEDTNQVECIMEIKDMISEVTKTIKTMKQ